MIKATSRNNDDIHRLIHSMTANEKRFFQLSHRQAGEKKYLKAFDMIAAQKDYNEAALKGAISNYGVIKNQLIAAIVKNLRNMPSTELSPDVALKNEVVEIKIMVHRGLLERAKKRIHAAKLFALEYQRYPELLELIHIEMKMFKDNEKAEKKMKRLEDFEKQIKHASESLNDLSSALLINEEFNIHLLKMKLVRDEDERKPFQKFTELPLIQTPDNALTFEAKVIYTLIKSTLFAVQGESDKSLKYRFKLIKEAKENPKLIAEIPNSYIAVLHNALLGAVVTNDEKKVHQLAGVMKNLPINSIHLRNTSAFSAYVLEHAFYKQRSKFEKAEESLLELENLILKKNMRVNLEHRQIFLMYKGDFYFFKGDMEKVSDSFGQIIFNKDFDHIRLENGAIARCLYLLSQFEKNQISYMKSLIKPFKKFMIKARYWHEPEKLVFEFLAKWNPAQSKDEKKKMLALYLAKLESAMKTTADSTLAKHYFDFVPWFQSKLTGRSCAELMAERTKAVRPK